MNTIDSRERSAFTPQEPHRTPWAVICALCATVAFLLGHIIWQTPTELPAGNLAGVSHAPLLRGKAENQIADVVSAVEPAVVSIDTTIKSDDLGSLGLPDLLKQKLHGGALKDPAHYEAHGSGSGVIIRSDGYILTNNHVVKDAENIKVTLSDNRVFMGRVIGRDAYSDIAMLKIDADGLATAPLGDSKGIRPGDWAIAIGTPLGLSHTVTMGIVSAIGRSLADLNNNIELIQTDAAINPGNSGGPLINIEGQVIGINMAIRTDAQNIGFSIPIDVAKDAASAIMDNRPILHPYLGLSMIDLDSDIAEVAGLSSRPHGVVVSKVADGSPAQASGISAGDVIERVDDMPVTTGGDVQKIVRAHRVGASVILHLLHKGKSSNVNVKLSAFPQAKPAG